MVADSINTHETKQSPKVTSEIKITDSKTVDLDKPPKPKSPIAEGTEQAPEVSTSTADEVVVLKKPPEDVALILLAEEEAELCSTANEEPPKEEPKPVNFVKPKRTKKDGAKSVWVSNISRSTKAADLKKLFSENFKVESAKIVTNGKSFFGYISLETAEMVQRSVKTLNGFNLAGRIISVSFMRPDLRPARVSTGDQTVKLGKEKPKQLNVNASAKTKEDKQEEKVELKKEVVEDSSEQPVKKKLDTPVIKSNSEDKIKKPHHEEIKSDRKDKTIESLKKDLNTAQSELRIAKRRLKDADIRVEFERTRKLELIKELSQLESELKLEKKKVIQDIEQAEKKRKLDEMRHEKDRRIQNKELEECKKLREYLQLRVDEMKTEKRHRSRSPIRRSPMRRNGPHSRSLPDREHGGMERGYVSMNKTPRSRVMHISPPKHREYEDRQRTAPSPPKITKRSSPSKRSRERSPLYKTMKKTRMDYSSNNYPSGPSEGNKEPLTQYPPMGSVGGPSRNASWNPSYKPPYRYSQASGPSAYPMIAGEVVHAPRFPSTRPLEYSEYHKRVPGGPRKY